MRSALLRRAALPLAAAVLHLLAAAGCDAGAGGADALAADARGGDLAGGSDGVGSGADVASGPRLVLDPSTLTFFDLPIGSLRGAVSGFAPAAGLCVTIVWDYSNTGHAPGAWCDVFQPMFPYVLLVESHTGGCRDWDYAGNAEVTAATGCVDFALLAAASMNLVDVEVAVSSPLFTGTVVASNRAALAPSPVQFSLRASAGEGDAWVQTADDFGLPTWVSVERDGDPLLLFDRCDLPLCGGSAGVCGVVQHQVRNLAEGGTEGQVDLFWDGRERVESAAGDCRDRVPVGSGQYVAVFCWAAQRAASGVDLEDPTCVRVPFRYPVGIVAAGTLAEDR